MARKGGGDRIMRSGEGRGGDELNIPLESLLEL